MMGVSNDSLPHSRLRPQSVKRVEVGVLRKLQTISNLYILCNKPQEPLAIVNLKSR